MKTGTDSQAFRDWPIGPDCPSFPCSGQVHVWRIRVCRLRSSASQWRTLLSPEENARADRFHFDRDRETWIITRGVLRTLIGRYLDLPGCNLEFVYNATGRPAVHPRLLTQDLRFNLSHSGQCSLIAFASGIDIGVDIESEHGHPDIEQVAPTVLSADEFARFQALDSDQRRAAMFAAWTRKEAVLKALGMGLSLAPDLVEVTFGPREEPVVRRAPDLVSPVSQWSLRSLDVGEDYSAALAAPVSQVELSLWDYPESTKTDWKGILPAGAI